ncbi:hypothetical protein RND81_01G164100 [Saponaria officinalis]|uniref:Uncharacterized protein n=1 Tax=Saponaria officinalis TaxID=3572 RepID=A0AAW1N847_SAPOF
MIIMMILFVFLLTLQFLATPKYLRGDNDQILALLFPGTFLNFYSCRFTGICLNMYHDSYLLTIFQPMLEDSVDKKSLITPLALSPYLNCHHLTLSTQNLPT